MGLPAQSDQTGERRLVGGRYRILRPLGQGGMGAVFEVEDTASRTKVALKQMGGRHEASIGDKAELRFRREYHSLARLTHPRIIEVFDYGVDDDGAYYTMELMSGRDLKDEGKVDWETACRLMRDIAAALAFLHSRRLIHRDLAPRNIRVTDDGRAKLFDFGLLATVGLSGEVAGTPSCIAPENLRGLPLDDRSDLYALGCLGYWMLTGRYPYPARKLDELERVWRKPAPPASYFEDDIPEALDTLVTSLLCLDPLGRPSSAAEVIDRLQAIGSLEPDPDATHTEGYLASAAMVGRRREMAVLKECVHESVEGHGRAIFIEATSGTGKSRLVREATLEAQLAGAKPLIAASDASNYGSYGVLHDLVADAIRVAPAIVTELDREKASVVARVFPDLARKLGPVRMVESVAEPAEERIRIQTALSGWFLELAQHTPIALFVDDVQRTDEASAAVLAGLARQAAEHSMLVCVALRELEDVRAPMAVSALRSTDLRLGLRGLTQDEVLELVESLFGKVRHAHRLAAWMHEVSKGSPLHCTELARTLVDTGAVKYADGVWILPADVASHDVPVELRGAMDARIAQLGETARKLAEVLAIYGNRFDLRMVCDLATKVGQQEGWLASLDELVLQSLLIGDGDRYRFRHDGLREAVLRCVDDERSQELHLAVGRHLQDISTDESDQAAIGWHLYEAGEELEGARYLEQAGRRLFEVQALADCVLPLEAALATFEKHGVARPKLLDLRFMLVAAGWISNREAGLRHMYPAVEGFREYAGLTSAEKLAPFVGRHLALVLGVLWAFVAWVFSLPRNRGPSPVRALSSYAVTAGYAAGLEYANHSLEGLHKLAEMTLPMNVFKGSMAQAAYLGMSAFPDLLMGRLGEAKRKLDQVLYTIQHDRLAPLTDFERRFSEAGIRSLIGQIQVTNLDPDLDENLEEMRKLNVRYYQLVADTMQATALRFRGEEREAQAIETGLEAVSLQLGSWSTDIQAVLFSHPGYGLTSDIMGLKRMADALERLCGEGFDYWGRLHMTRGDYHRSRGEYDEAQACLERALEAVKEQERLTRMWVVASLAEVHLAKENFELAAELAREALGWSEDPETIQVSIQIRAQRALALAEAAMGEIYSAEHRLDDAIEQARAVGAAASTGLCHEARARVALMHEDHAGYYLHCAEANRWLRPTGNPALVGVAERLVESGPNAHAEPDLEQVEAADSTTTVNKPDTVPTVSEQDLRSDHNTVH